jgi:hypothetical protein
MRNDEIRIANFGESDMRPDPEIDMLNHEEAEQIRHEDLLKRARDYIYHSGLSGPHRPIGLGMIRNEILRELDEAMALRKQKWVKR